jgi:hypothetical protein
MRGEAKIRKNPDAEEGKSAFESGFFSSLESTPKRLEKPLKNPIYSIT